MQELEKTIHQDIQELHSKETEQWNVRIQTDGKRYNIGTYDDLAEAIEAHNMAKGKYRAETQVV